MNKRQLKILDVLLNGGKYGELATLVHDAVYSSSGDLAKVAAGLSAAELRSDERDNKLAQLRKAMISACEKLGRARLTVSNETGTWCVVSSQPRSRVQTKITTLVAHMSEIVPEMSINQRKVLLARMTKILNVDELK